MRQQAATALGKIGDARAANFLTHVLGDDEQKVYLSPAFSYQYITSSLQLIYHSPIGPISASVNSLSSPILRAVLWI